MIDVVDIGFTVPPNIGQIGHGLSGNREIVLGKVRVW
jgi:hypothetical protein